MLVVVFSDCGHWFISRPGLHKSYMNTGRFLQTVLSLEGQATTLISIARNLRATSCGWWVEGCKQVVLCSTLRATCVRPSTRPTEFSMEVAKAPRKWTSSFVASASWWTSIIRCLATIARLRWCWKWLGQRDLLQALGRGACLQSLQIPFFGVRSRSRYSLNPHQHTRVFNYNFNQPSHKWWITWWPINMALNAGWSMITSTELQWGAGHWDHWALAISECSCCGYNYYNWLYDVDWCCVSWQWFEISLATSTRTLHQTWLCLS